MTDTTVDTVSPDGASADTGATPEIDVTAGQVSEAGSPATPEGTPPAPADDKPQGKPESWAHKRLGQYAERVRERDAALAERDARIAEYERRLNPNASAPDAQRQPTTADVERLANERADKIAADRAFTEDCNSIAAAGKSAHPDFMDAISTLNMVAGITPALIEAVKEAGDPAALLYQLGKDPAEAERILALSPARMGAALAKLAARPAPTVPVSRAPAPITPVAGAARVEADPEKMSMEDYVKWRDARDAKRK